jgi:hypothetical protein
MAWQRDRPAIYVGAGSVINIIPLKHSRLASYQPSYADSLAASLLRPAVSSNSFFDWADGCGKLIYLSLAPYSILEWGQRVSSQRDEKVKANGMDMIETVHQYASTIQISLLATRQTTIFQQSTTTLTSTAQCLSAHQLPYCKCSTSQHWEA